MNMELMFPSTSVGAECRGQKRPSDWEPSGAVAKRAASEQEAEAESPGPPSFSRVKKEVKLPPPIPKATTPLQVAAALARLRLVAAGENRKAASAEQMAARIRVLEKEVQSLQDKLAQTRQNAPPPRPPPPKASKPPPQLISLSDTDDET